MHHRMQPVAESVEDRLLANFATRQAEGSLTNTDRFLYQIVAEDGAALTQTPADVLAAPAKEDSIVFNQ